MSRQETMTADTLKQQAKVSAKTRLENRFMEAFSAVKPEGVPMPEREYRFHPVRKWRFDMAWPDIALAVEIAGGAFVRGRHNTGTGQAQDYEKHNAASLLGWTVLYFGTVQMKDASECAAYVVDVMVQIGRKL